MKNQPIKVIAYFADTDDEGNSFVVRLALGGFKERDIAGARPLSDKILKGY